MTQIAEIPIQDWLPDRPSYKNPGCEVADNVLPTPAGFGPFSGLSAQDGEFSGAVKGAAQFFTDDGQNLIVGGTDGALFTRRGGTVTDTTGTTSIGTNEKWDFCRFNSFVIATAQNNAPQHLANVSSDNVWTELTGSPPLASRCARVLDFVMMGDIAEAPNRLQWSAFNNPAGDWAADRLTQAGFADLDPAGGKIQRIVGGRYATVFQRRAVSRLSYIGPPVVWQADVISEDRGAIAPFSVVNIGYYTYFLAQDGFYVTNGSAMEPIGTQRVNKWFFDTADSARLDRVEGAIDLKNRCVCWAFHSLSEDEYDRLIIYSWEENRWSTATVSTQSLVSSPLDGTTLEQLDDIYPSLDAMPLSLDDSTFVSRGSTLAAFYSSGGSTVYGTFTGAPLAATWTTGRFQPSPGKRVFVNEATPMIDADAWDCTVTLNMRDNRNGAAQSSTRTTGWGGFAAVRGEGKTASLTVMKPAGTWADMSAVQVKFTGAGER